MIIGLIGCNRVGKDTFANILCNEYNFYKYALADPIKEVARIMFDFDEEQLYGNKKEEIDNRWGISPREFYQQFGTNIMQFDIYNYLKDLNVKPRCFWVSRMEYWINKQKEKGINNIVIPDIRFKHEAEYLKNIGCILIKITRNNPLQTNNNQNIVKHISQTENNKIKKEDIQYHIENNSNLEHYIQKIKNMINEIII